MVETILIIIVYQNSHQSLFLIILRFGQTKNVLINNLRIGVTKTKLHKKIGKNLKHRIKLIPIKRAKFPKKLK